jgi:hypothetical protein
MRNSDSALYDWLERYWAANGLSPSGWSKLVGLSPSTVLRWAHSDPDISSLRAIAQATGMTMIELLVIAEIITPDEANGIVPREPLEPAPYSVEDAIDHDPQLSDQERKVLRAALDLVRQTKRTGRSARKVIR